VPSSSRNRVSSPAGRCHLLLGHSRPDWRTRGRPLRGAACFPDGVSVPRNVETVQDRGLGRGGLVLGRAPGGQDTWEGMRNHDAIDRRAESSAILRAILNRCNKLILVTTLDNSTVMPEDPLLPGHNPGSSRNRNSRQGTDGMEPGSPWPDYVEASDRPKCLNGQVDGEQLVQDVQGHRNTGSGLPAHGRSINSRTVMWALG